MNIRCFRNSLVSIYTFILAMYFDVGPQRVEVKINKNLVIFFQSFFPN